MYTYEGTAREVKKNDKVSWMDEEVKGIIEAVTNDGFIVKWEDTGMIDYSPQQIKYLVRV